MYRSKAGKKKKEVRTALGLISNLHQTVKNASSNVKSNSNIFKITFRHFRKRK